MDGDRYNNRVDNLVWRPRWFAVQYNRQFRKRYENRIDCLIRDVNSGKIYSDSFECATRCGLLENDLVGSILNRTYVGITYQQFEMVE